MSMIIYTPFENSDLSNDDNLICLPDRFSWFAFLLPPVWALTNRLWLILLMMVVAIVSLVALAAILTLPVFALYILFAIWLGFEANHLRGQKLTQMGWAEKPFIFANGPMQAEAKYFSRARRMLRAQAASSSGIS